MRTPRIHFRERLYRGVPDVEVTSVKPGGGGHVWLGWDRDTGGHRGWGHDRRLLLPRRHDHVRERQAPRGCVVRGNPCHLGGGIRGLHDRLIIRWVQALRDGRLGPMLCAQQSLPIGGMMRVTLSLAMVDIIPQCMCFWEHESPVCMVHARMFLNLFSSNLMYFHLGDFVLDVVMYKLT